MVLVQNPPRALERYLLGWRFTPRKLQKPVDIGPNNAYFRRRGRRSFKPVDFLQSLFADVLRHRRRLDRLPQFRGVFHLSRRNPQLALNGLKLLPEIELPLDFLYPVLDLRLYAPFDIEDVVLLGEMHARFVKPVVDVDHFQKFLTPPHPHRSVIPH